MAAATIDIFDMFQLAGVPGTIFVTWILFSLLRGKMHSKFSIRNAHSRLCMYLHLLMAQLYQLHGNWIPLHLLNTTWISQCTIPTCKTM